jgi:hypothetical protein
MSKKFEYFKNIIEVSKTVDGDKIKLIGKHRNGQHLIVEYVDGAGHADCHVFSVNNAGVTSRLETVNDKGRLRVNRNNSRVHVNEIIWQLDRIYQGLPVIEGSYNHFYPIAYGSEVMSASSGDVIPKVQNELHWDLARKIKKDTGWKCWLPSYGKQVYALAGLTKITDQHLINLENQGLIKRISK